MMIIKLEGNFICFTETTISIETEVDAILILSEKKTMLLISFSVNIEAMHFFAGSFNNRLNHFNICGNYVAQVRNIDQCY